MKKKKQTILIVIHIALLAALIGLGLLVFFGHRASVSANDIFIKFIKNSEFEAVHAILEYGVENKNPFTFEDADKDSYIDKKGTISIHLKSQNYLTKKKYRLILERLNQIENKIAPEKEEELFEPGGVVTIPDTRLPYPKEKIQKNKDFLCRLGLTLTNRSSLLHQHEKICTILNSKAKEIEKRHVDAVILIARENKIEVMVRKVEFGNKFSLKTEMVVDFEKYDVRPSKYLGLIFEEASDKKHLGEILVSGLKRLVRKLPRW